jgi:predicted DsbA family dithiol-disulfide isomerase
MPDTIAIAVYSDVICPWCYVGKRRLEAAVNDLGISGQLNLSWHPFELNPDMPAEGVERRAYRMRKFGEARSAELDRNMIETGRELGINFGFDRMQRTPNTRLAHRLIWEAGRQNRQDALVERLFYGYFEEALDIGSPEVLVRLAAEVGLDASVARAALTSADSLEAVMELERQGLRLGIRGVPFFVVAQKYQVSGAQPARVWRDALRQVAAEAAAAPALS